MSDDVQQEVPAPAEAAAAETKPGEGGLRPAPPGSMFAAVETDEPTGKPEWLPEQFWDVDSKQARWEQLARSWADLRSKIARGEGKLPESPDEYVLPKRDGLPEVPADDRAWAKVRQAAHQAGLTQAQLEAVAAAYLEAAAEAGVLQPPADLKARVEAELAKLGPNGRAVVKDVNGWVTGLVARGVLTGEEADSLRAVADAAGVRALGKLKALLGEKPIPLEALDDGRLAYEDARRMMEEALRTKNETLWHKAERALREHYARQPREA